MQKLLWIGTTVAGMVFSTTVFAGEITVGGGGAACSGFFSPVAELVEAETGIKVKVAPTSPVQGLIDLNEGRVDVATAAVPIAAMIKEAAKKGVALDSDHFEIMNLGMNRTLVFTHKTNTISALTRKQLQDIFSGKTRNWKDFGGDDREIIVIWGLETPGQNELFTNQVLEGKPVVSSALKAKGYREIIEVLTRTPGGIAIDPHGFASNATRNPKTPPVTSPAIAITKEKPTPEIRRLLSYIRDYNTW